MTFILDDRVLPELLILASIIAAGMLLAVVAGRLYFGWSRWKQRRFTHRYAHTIQQALQGDQEAIRVLAGSPSRDRLPIAQALILPLISDRSQELLARTTAVLGAMDVRTDADRLLGSRLWWRRAVALRAFGLLQRRNRTPEIVAALDDENADVRGAALDALADLRDPAALQAIVVRLQDATLHRGRRLQALTAYGAEAESFVMDLASIDPEHRRHYCRALAVCGTAACRPALYAWAREPSAELRAASLMALSHVGLDVEGAQLAVAALDGEPAEVRAAAAKALHGWNGPLDVTLSLARRLDDEWTVAVPSARALQSIVPRGAEALRGASVRQDLAGVLSRQMLWELQPPC